MTRAPRARGPSPTGPRGDAGALSTGSLAAGGRAAGGRAIGRNGALVRALASMAVTCALLCGCNSERSWIEENAADSAAADQTLASGHTGQAVARLRRIARRPVPSEVASEDARVVRQDAFERWARIELARGANEEAISRSDEGLALGTREDVFTANLLTTRGRANEALGRDREAAEDYHRALVIEEALLTRALGGDDER